MEQYHKAIEDPTIFEEILVKHVGYVQLYNSNLSISDGQNMLDAMKIFKPQIPPPKQLRNITSFIWNQVNLFPTCSEKKEYPEE